MSFFFHVASIKSTFLNTKQQMLEVFFFYYQICTNVVLLNNQRIHRTTTTTPPNSWHAVLICKYGPLFIFSKSRMGGRPFLKQLELYVMCYVSHLDSFRVRLWSRVECQAKGLHQLRQIAVIECLRAWRKTSLCACVFLLNLVNRSFELRVLRWDGL